MINQGIGAPLEATATGLTGSFVPDGYVLVNDDYTNAANGVTIPTNPMFAVADTDDAVLLFAGQIATFPDILAMLAVIGDVPFSTGISTPSGDPLYAPIAQGDQRLVLPRSQP
jgi:hypothetical protein